MPMTLPVSPCGHLQRGVADLARLLAEDRAEQPLLRGQLRLALGRDLADQDVAGLDLGSDPDDAALVQVREDLLGDVRDVPGDLLGAELGVAGVDLVLFDVDRGEHVVLHQALGQDDRVLVVVALPRHDRHEQVLTEGHLAVFGARPVREHLARLDPRALFDDRLLVRAGALVAAAELVQPVGLTRAVVGHHRDEVRAQLLDDTGLLGHDHVTGVDRGAQLHAGADQRRLGAEQRHGLALHVRAHQRAVRVVVLEERDHRGRDRHHLPRRDVDVVDGRRGDVVDLAALATHQHALARERPVVGERLVRLRDDEPVFLVRSQVVDLLGGDAAFHLAVRRLDEAERVDLREAGQRPDQADVRAFRGLDRAHAAVVAVVHVADLEAGPLSGQAARTQRGQTPLVRQAGQRVGLVHELRQLGRAEELLDRSHDRPNVDQGLRRDRLDVLSGHPLADDPLHAREADPDLVLDQLAHGAQAPVAEVVDVVGLDRDLDAVRRAHRLLARVQAHEVLDGGADVVLGQRADRGVDRQAQLLVGLVPADLGKVVALVLEEQVLQQGLRALAGGRLARAQLAVDVEQRLVLAGGVVLLQGGDHRLGEPETLLDLLRGPAERLEQHSDRLAALAVDPDTDGVALVHVELQPRAAAGDDLDRVDVLLGRLVDAVVEVDARRADELRDHDALGAVDDECALVGHHGEVAHEDRLALDLAGGVVGELRSDEQRSRVRHVLVLALLDGGLDLVEARVGEGQRHRAGEVFDRRDLGEDLLETADRVLVTGVEATLEPRLVPDQPLERLGLQVEQVGHPQRLADLREGDPRRRSGQRQVVRGGCGGRGGAGRSQDASFRELCSRLAGTGPAR